MKPLGGRWMKVAEWIDGQTPNFSWIIPTQNVGGHRVFRMPTTIEGADSWIYMDDFAMATTEDSLPVYDGEIVAPPSPPVDLTIVPHNTN